MNTDDPLERYAAELYEQYRVLAHPGKGVGRRTGYVALTERDAFVRVVANALRYLEKTAP